LSAPFACIACGHTAFQLLTEAGRGGKPARFWICDRCGTIRQDPEFKSHWDARETYASGAYFQENSGIPPGRLMKFQREEARVRLWFLRRAGVAPPGRILEIGCSAGAFLWTARRAGFDVEGVEPDPVMAKFVKEDLNIAVHHGLWEDLKWPGPWDAICAFHVIEHIEDVDHFLKFARERLAPAGRLILETPDALRPWTHRLAWTDWFDLGHVVGYHARSLAAVLRRNGFEPALTDEDDQLRVAAIPGAARASEETWGDLAPRVKTAFEEFRRHHVGRRRRRALGRMLTAPIRKLVNFWPG
jgi:2-polyprenyl-3-methyl-5-hydroxy-6-metoxy-1,4-benzoquinol methylase